MFNLFSSVNLKGDFIMKRRMNGEGTIYYDKTKKLWIGQKTINGKRKKVASKTQKELKEKLKDLENNIVTSSSTTLIQLIEKIQKDKLGANIINEGTYYRNTATTNHIKGSNIANSNISKITWSEIQIFLNTKLYLSQSYINKIYNMINEAFETAIKENLILKNPMLNVTLPISNQTTKEVIAFEVAEQRQLMTYIQTHDLIGATTCNYDTNTIKNLILLGLFYGMRGGELGAINYKTDIDRINQCFEIKRSLTRDKNGKTKIGSTTKTGKKQIKKGREDKKIIPFSAYDTATVCSILDEQIAIAQNNPLNTNNLLFCRQDGNPIVLTETNCIFKRICREAGIKLDLKTGCHFHMLRHTFVTRCIEAGIPLPIIAKLLGHTTTKQIEETYGHILDKFRNNQLENLNNYYCKENIIFVDRFRGAI